jgi:hypothetical protein
VILILLLKDAPGAVAILLLTLAVSLWLTAVELRDLKPRRTWWVWWMSLVALTHFVGYVALRIYVAYRRRNSARA